MHLCKLNKNLQLVLTAALFSCQSFQVQASAFGIKEQGFSNLGNAFAGTAAYAQDATTGWFNPAGLSYLKNHQVVAGSAYVMARSTLSVERAKNNVNVDATGEDVTKLSSSEPIPNFHMAYVFNDKFAFSVNVVVPFGLSTVYNDGSKARYKATKSKVATVDNSINMSYKYNDEWSFGFGLDALYVRATLNAATFFAAEGYSKNKGHGWGFGYHAGVMWQVSDLMRMGLAYHSRISPRTVGSNDKLNVPGAFTKFTAKVNLPYKIVYSIVHKYSEKWTAMADFEFAHWSATKDIRLSYQDEAQDRFTQEWLAYRNTWRLSFGADYTYRPKHIFKWGLGYEKSPLDDENRTARVPDANRIWAALGYKYVGSKLWIDAGYARLFIRNGTINATAPIGPSVRNQSLQGKYNKNSADILGLQFVWNF